MKAYRQGNDIAVTWPFKDKITGEPFDFSGLEVAVTAQIGNCRPMKMDITITGNVITFTHAGKDQPSVGVVTLTLFCNKNVSGMVTLDTKDGYEIVAHSWEAEGYDEGEISTDGVYLESSIDAGIRGADAGFGTIDAEVDDTTGTPSVDVTTSGPNTAKNIRFHFSGLKGQPGSGGEVTRASIEQALNDSPGKNLSTEDFTSEDKTKLDGIEPGAQKNVKSDWNAASGDAEILNKPDLSQYITKSVDDLVNYYLKSDTYTKAEVQALIGAIQQFHYEVYASISDVTNPQSNVLYLIGPTGTGSDKYEEYVWPDAQTGFVKIGDTSIDLSGYITTSALNTALADYTTTANLTTLLAGKQDTISDLAAIRSGAAAGATAYQKPSGGIPSSDMASGVQTSLGKADTAEQTSNKTTTLSASSTDTQYPSAKAVYDSFYKRGVISQTQTWTRAQDGGYDYVMSNLIYGDIPKSNIDLYEAAGATFNATTGYFELNGLTDISYEEMSNIYNASNINLILSTNYEYRYCNSTLRTVLPFPNPNYVGFTPNLTNCFMKSAVEAISFPQNGFVLSAASGGMFVGSYKLKDIVGVLDMKNITSLSWNTFVNCDSLSSNFLKNIKSNYSLPNSPRLSLASILYMINNEAATSAITITLHATAYARAIADTDVQTALQNHPLVTLASAT